MDLRNIRPDAELTGRSVGHYRLQELIGRGGMGEVYRAHDRNLNRDVAIKVLPSHLAADDTSRKRFIRETHLASKVVHPYVATVFDVIEESGALFLVMEYIEGRRLSQELRESRPDHEHALQWGIEITEGLSAIHQENLVHRDLKPGNVMITGTGHIKVMDFGLARPAAAPLTETTVDADAETTITGEGARVGTVLYMSPEQLRGQPVDRRSDLFSLGILLYEAVAGIHPFRRETLHESASAILNDPPARGSDPESLTHTGPLRDVLHRLLEKDPDRRYQSSDELLEDLRTVSQTAPRLVDWHPASRKLLRFGVPIVVVLAATAALGAYWINRPPTWDRPRYSVAVVPFIDRTGDDDGSIRAEMVANLLTTDIEASHLLRAIGPIRTTPLIESLPRNSPAAEISGRVSNGTAVDYVLIGTLYHEGPSYVATVEFITAGEGLPQLPSMRSEAGTALALAEALGGELRNRLPDVSALTAWRDDRTDLGDIRSESEEAVLLYNQGLLALREGEPRLAIRQFEEAVRIDPRFVMAQTMLAQSLQRSGFGRRARDVAKTALTLAPAADSRAAERLSLLARATWADVYGRTDELVEVTGRLSSLFPDEPAILTLGAEARERAGEYPVALDLIDRALALDPRSAPKHRFKATVQILLRDFDGASASLDRAAEIFTAVDSTRGLAGVHYIRGQLLQEQERFDEALEELSQATDMFAGIGDDLNVAEVNNQIADAYMLRGEPAVAGPYLRAAIRAARQVGHRSLECRALSSQGAGMFMAGEIEDAERILLEAADLARQLENERLLINPLSNLASLLTYGGRLEEARPLLFESIDVARGIGAKNEEVKVLLLLSDVDYQLGDLEIAKKSYRRVLEDKEVEGVRRLSLWAYAGLAEILERQGRLGEALEAIELGIEASRTLSIYDVLGYSLAQRGQILAALGRPEAAMLSIEEAHRIASSARTGLEDLLSRCALARGHVRAYEGRWREAVAEAEEALAGAALPAIAVAARTLACQGQRELNLIDDAVANCRGALQIGPAPLAETVTARSALVSALIHREADGKLRFEALACKRQAEQMGLLLPQASAAAVLARLPEELMPGNIEEIRREGRAALEAYVASAPEADRPAVRERADIRRLMSVL